MRHQKCRNGAGLFANPAFIDVRADRRHYACSFVAKLRRQSRGLKVLTAAEHHLCPVESDCFYIQADFALSRLRNRFFLTLQHFWPADGMKADNSCGFFGHVDLLVSLRFVSITRMRVPHAGILAHDESANSTCE